MSKQIVAFAFAIVASAGALAAAPAAAGTAVFVAPASLTPSELTDISTAGDGSGLLLGLNQTLAIVLAQPVGLVRNADRISVFTLAPAVGRSRFAVSFGAWNNGAPSIVRTVNVRSGNTLTVANLFQSGCAVLGGCDYIAITTNRVRAGAPGAILDHIDVNGEVTQIAAPSPEPSAWALMIMGFAALGWRMKAARSSRQCVVGSA